jgi:AraC-like DNA-binding protein
VSKKPSRESSSKVALWRRRSYEVLTSEVVASRNPGPKPPPEWASALHELTELSRTPEPAPAWWTPKTAFFGSIETRTDPTSYYWDGMKRLGLRDTPLCFFQLTMAGWGQFQLYGQAPRQVLPGMGFFAVIPSEHRYFLPQESPGWTFGWIGIYHPYLVERIAKQVLATDPLVRVEPDGLLAAAALRLLRGAIKKDFRDRYDVELALIEFVIAYERCIYPSQDGPGEGQRLLSEIRNRVVVALPEVIDVNTLAAEYGMSRTHFSHFFRSRTGMTPAHFATGVRVHQAARMLLDTRFPLKQIADACGFADANHLCKVFRRFQHLSPASYRRVVL